MPLEAVGTLPNWNEMENEGSRHTDLWYVDDTLAYRFVACQTGNAGMVSLTKSCRGT